MPRLQSLCRLFSRLSRDRSQAETLDELNHHLREVLDMLLEDGEPRLETRIVGRQTIEIASP